MNGTRGAKLKKKKQKQKTKTQTQENPNEAVSNLKKKKRCKSQLVFFFFLTEDKLQITPLKFKVVWILHAKILKFEFYP